MSEIRWCSCGDEILIEGDKCEVCKFMEDVDGIKRPYYASENMTKRIIKEGLKKDD